MNEKRITDEEASQQAEEILEQMTLEEIASQLTYRSPAVKRLGIPEYNWWNEALHGVARAGTATIFPQAIALAAMFDEEMMLQIADIISTEGRAKYNEYSSKNDRDIYKGLTFWSPNVNIFRDPRWGRGHETFGEDPYLTSRLGVAFIKGLQGDGKYLKSAACAKHFAVHSGPEALRHEFDAIVGQKDLYETYLPAFEACVKEAQVESVMGAYNRVNGEPCCASKTLLLDILREKWGFKGHVVSDCGAIADFHNHHKVTATPYESAALALNNGCDLNCGNIYLYAIAAMHQGLLKEEVIRNSAKRLFATRIKLGMFADDCEYDEIPYEANDTLEHHQASLEAAKKSVVLLKNQGILPLDIKKLNSIAVIGPNADNQTMLKGNYAGTASRYITILEGIHEAAGDQVRVYYSEGCHLFKKNVEGDLARPNDRISEAISVAERGDVVLLCLGYDAEIEGEQGDPNNPYAAGDKAGLNLPGMQQLLLEQIVALGKPTILLLGVGSAVTFHGAEDQLDAILNVWYPGSFGGRAAASVLFGECSPSGKLPITFYKSERDLPAFEDYSMKNRTYRFMEREALYPFGYGLTYSTIEIGDMKIPNELGRGFKEVEVSIQVTNTGNYHIEEVVQCYVKDLEAPLAVRNYSLAGFKRITLAIGETKIVSLTLNCTSFEVVDENGDRKLNSSKFKIYMGTSQPDQVSLRLGCVKPLEKTILIK